MNAAFEQIHATAMLLLPEIILLATVCVLFLAGPMLVTDAGQSPPGLRHQWGFLSLSAIAVAGRVVSTVNRTYVDVHGP